MPKCRLHMPWQRVLVQDWKVKIKFKKNYLFFKLFLWNKSQAERTMGALCDADDCPCSDPGLNCINARINSQPERVLQVRCNKDECPCKSTGFNCSEDHFAYALLSCEGIIAVFLFKVFNFFNFQGARWTPHVTTKAASAKMQALAVWKTPASAQLMRKLFLN